MLVRAVQRQICTANLGTTSQKTPFLTTGGSCPGTSCLPTSRTRYGTVNSEGFEYTQRFPGQSRSHYPSIALLVVGPEASRPPPSTLLLLFSLSFFPIYTCLSGTSSGPKTSTTGNLGSGFSFPTMRPGTVLENEVGMMGTGMARPSV